METPQATSPASAARATRSSLSCQAPVCSVHCIPASETARTISSQSPAQVGFATDQRDLAGAELVELSDDFQAFLSRQLLRAPGARTRPAVSTFEVAGQGQLPHGVHELVVPHVRGAQIPVGRGGDVSGSASPIFSTGSLHTGDRRLQSVQRLLHLVVAIRRNRFEVDLVQGLSGGLGDRLHVLQVIAGNRIVDRRPVRRTRTPTRGPSLLPFMFSPFLHLLSGGRLSAVIDEDLLSRSDAPPGCNFHRLSRQIHGPVRVGSSACL